MTEKERREAWPLLIILLMVGAAISINLLRDGLRTPASPSARPILATLACALVVFVLLFLIVRAVSTRRELQRRSRLLLLPAPSFDPSEEAVLRFASALSRTPGGLRGLLSRAAAAVRVVLDTDEKGRLRYSIELPTKALPSLRAAAAAYDEVELRELPPGVGATKTKGTKVVRAEMGLARPSSQPLRLVGLEPDPLAGFAKAMQGLVAGSDDGAEVCIDLLPMAPTKRRRVRGRLLRSARRDRPAGTPIAPVLDPPTSGTPPAELVGRRAGQRALTSKLGSPEPLFRVQILIRVSSKIPGRAKTRLLGLLAGFDIFAGDNHWRAAGVRVPGFDFLGADLPHRRHRFDTKIETGRFAPARRGLVTASEIAGLLKPPTVHCPIRQVLRSAGAIPAPPDELPSFVGQAGLLPIGKVETESGDRLVGVPLQDTLFSYMAGRSRWGKSETAIGQFLHLARSGHGCLFLDPHEDAIQKAKRYLADAGLRDRVIEINLGSHGANQPGWNLLSIEGKSERQIQGQVDAVVDAIASTMRWDEHNTRALNLTTQAAQGLVAIARRLPPELAPTIFQIPTLLGNPEWRADALPLLSAPTRRFFVERLPLLSDEAITPVTNLIDRLRAAPTVSALLGNPRSSYDIRRAMDEGKIVLLCPGEGSTRDRLLANFFVYDFLHAAKSRSDIRDPAKRRPFFAFLDEIQIYDGATSGNLAALLEQSAKFGARVFAFNQNPERLIPATWNAISTNRSHLGSTALGSKAAGMISREWAGAVGDEVIASLPKYSSIWSITLGGEISAPFLVRGVPVEELMTDDATDKAGAEALEAAIDSNLSRQPIADTLIEVDRHDERIAAQMSAGASHPSEPTGTLELSEAD